MSISIEASPFLFLEHTREVNTYHADTIIKMAYRDRDSSYVKKLVEIPKSLLLFSIGPTFDLVSSDPNFNKNFEIKEELSSETLLPQNFIIGLEGQVYFPYSNFLKPGWLIDLEIHKDFSIIK